MGVLLLALGWAGWAVLHSLLIHPRWVTWCTQRHPDLRPWYRLLYNCVALATLLPLFAYKYSLSAQHLPPHVLMAWPWWLTPLRWLGLAWVLFLAWAGAKAYDLGWISGLSQLRCADDQPAPQQKCTPQLHTNGILGHVRHPWYSAGLVLLWVRVTRFDLPELVTSLILSIYLVLGTWLEEQKLRAHYGRTYQHYQNAVPMFFPRLRRRQGHHDLP